MDNGDEKEKNRAKIPEPKEEWKDRDSEAEQEIDMRWKKENIQNPL